MRAAEEADATGKGRDVARWATFVVVGWIGEDGYRSQDGDEEGGKMHAGCCFLFFVLIVREIGM